MKEFNLKKSEIKKVVRDFEFQTGIEAEIGGYGFYDGAEDFKAVKIEMDRKDNGRRCGTVELVACMFDRRRSWVSSVEAC